MAEEEQYEWGIGLGDLLLGLAGFELGNWLIQGYERRQLFRAAEEYARSEGKPLLVVGEPRGRHGYGDVCVDASGRDPKCLKEDVTALPFDDRQFGAAFVGHVLEHVEDFDAAMNEISRVADRVFVAYPHPWSLIAWLHPDHRWLLVSREPAAPGVRGAFRIGEAFAAPVQVNRPRIGQETKVPRSLSEFGWSIVRGAGFAVGSMIVAVVAGKAIAKEIQGRREGI